MFFDGDNSSGVSGDLESATQVATFMEGYWGMGSTVSSYSTAQRLRGRQPAAGRAGREGEEPEKAMLRRALADRIEDKLGDLLARAETSCWPRTGPRCSRWRTRWRRTRR